MDGTSGKGWADGRRRGNRRNHRGHFDCRGKRWNTPFCGRRRTRSFGGWPIRARLGTRRWNSGQTVLFHVRPFGAFFDGDSHSTLGFFLHRIGDVESVVAAQLDGHVFID
jgi:hypothetical protein